MINILQIQDNR